MGYFNSDQVYEQYFKPLGLSKATLYRAIRMGKLRATLCGKRYIITEKALDDYFSGEYLEEVQAL